MALPEQRIMIVWLTTIAARVGLYAHRPGGGDSVRASASDAILLILEMHDPPGRLMNISDAPIRTAINYRSQ